jgi:hypothetical protein
MRRSWIVVVFLIFGAGATGLGAGGTADMQGSLFDFTTAMIALCPGTAGPYGGSGSDGGQRAMLTGSQQVAPMLRFLDGGACSGSAAAPSRSQGLVFGLESVAFFGSRATIGGTECNGDVNQGCDANFQPATGAAYDTTMVGTDGVAYTFNGWRDVLRVLLAGFHHDVIPTDQWVRRQCNSPVRQALAESYGAFFENNCTANAGEAAVDGAFAPACTKIRHVFRPDDFSAATETIVGLLGLPAVILPETTVGGVLQHTGATPFCNAVRPSFVYAAPQPTTLQGSDATWDPTAREVLPNGREIAVYRATMQDNDPIRRLCAGSGLGLGAAEDNCSHSGDLGLVLPINAVEENPPHSNLDRYNAKSCGRAVVTVVAAPEVFDASTQAKLTCAEGLLCPNGDICNNFGGCFAPADESGNPQCLATKLTTPALTASFLAVPSANPMFPALSDGRAYNQHLYDASGAYQMLSRVRAMAVTGAYYRIHASHSLASPADAGAPPTCQRADVTDQIGCLVTASPCSLGYAGHQVLTTNGDIGAVKIDRQSPVPGCIQDEFRYPVSTKIYFNTATGFAFLSGEELQLARCMTDLAQSTGDSSTPAGLVSGLLLSTNIAAAGFLPIPDAVNGGEPYCEDFNEAALCSPLGAPTISNVNSCRTPPPNFDAFPTFNTVCGDGVVDAFEDCDDGAANGPLPARCSYGCRLNH